MRDKTQAFLMDCMEGMKQYPDKYFDLAIVDPPYGINAANMQLGNGKKQWSKGKDWDVAPPPQDYFDELMRVSKEQIVWGGNYFTDKLPVARCWISWNKIVPSGMSFSDLELAWTSFDQVAREVRLRYSGASGKANYQSRIHPTQKPIGLYSWLLGRYAKPGDKILDTHLGSGSSRIASYDMGFEFVGFEIDSDYFEAQEKRFSQHKSQLKLSLI